MEKKLSKDEEEHIKDWKEVIQESGEIQLSGREKAWLQRAYFAVEQGRQCNFVVGGPVDQDVC